MSRRAALWGSLLLAGAALVFGIFRAVRLAWLADDSFVSFRYAWNLAHGHGLVYNAGERVEGYSNLSWTLLMAGGLALGVKPEASSTVLGILCWILLVGLLALRSWQRREGRSFVPLAAALVLLMDDFQTWATGGLETSLFTLLSVAGVLLACESREPRGLILAGCVLAAGVATRPDGAIFAAVGVAGAWFVNSDESARPRFRRASLVALPLLAGAVALVSFKLAYYGDLFPTAFYSKSALDPYYRQGLYYVWLFAKKNWFLVPLVAVLAIGSAPRFATVATRENMVLLAAGGLFTAYVAHSGGDFMFGRRLIPAMPFLFLVLEDAFCALPGMLSRASVIGLVALGVTLPYPIYANPTEKIRGIANEPAYSAPAYIAAREAQARAAADALAHSPVRAMFEGGMCMFGYYSRLPYLAEMSGLTQYSLARRPLVARGYVGHEKTGDAQWLTDNRIQLVFLQALPPVPRIEPRRVDEIYFGDTLKARIWIYVDAVMDPLRGNPAVQFVPIEQALDVARRRIAQASGDEAQAIYEFVDRYYFRNAGATRQSLAEEFKTAVRLRREGKPGA